MKRLVLLFALFVAGLCSVIVPSAIADKPPAPPGQGECDKGNSTNQCTTDPSTNGKDCEPHGNNGGVNEDHCLTTTAGTTTTTPSTSTTTTTTTTSTTTTNETTTRETTSTTTPQTTSTPTGTSTPNTTTSSEAGTTTTKTNGITTPIGPTVLPKPKCDDGSNPPCPTPDAAPPLKQIQRTTEGTKGVSTTKGELPYTGVPLIFVVLLSLGMMTTGLYLRRRSTND